MRKQPHWTGIVLLMAACTAALSAGAQEAPAGEAPVQAVEVTGVRDPAMMPYGFAFDMLTKVRKVSNGKMDMTIRVLSGKTDRPVPGLEVVLQGESSREKLALSPDGFLTVPLSQALLDDKAVFLTNKKKGTLKVEYYFVPTLPKEQLRFEDIAASIAAANRARSEVLAWYLRLLVPAIHEVRLCYPDNTQQITVTSGDATSKRPAAAGQTSMLTKETVFCAAFSAPETEAAKDAVVTLPPGWTALFN